MRPAVIAWRTTTHSDPLVGCHVFQSIKLTMDLALATLLAQLFEWPEKQPLLLPYWPQFASAAKKPKTHWKNLAGYANSQPFMSISPVLFSRSLVHFHTLYLSSPPASMHSLKLCLIASRHSQRRSALSCSPPSHMHTHERTHTS